VSNARLWTPQDFPLCVLKGNPGFAKVRDRTGHACPLLPVAGRLEVAIQAHCGLVGDLLQVNDLP
jgi:hypothetical protein